MLSVEAAFIEQLYSHQASGTLFYTQDLRGWGRRRADAESPQPGLCRPAWTWKQRAGCRQSACSARARSVSGKKNTKYWFFYSFFKLVFSLAMILI